ncbi:hypothetical protein B0H12DRAFT_1301064, partial [Mycena haematopus]
IRKLKNPPKNQARNRRLFRQHAGSVTDLPCCLPPAIMDMPQAEQPTPKTQDHNVDEETAASKLWAMYISEAEKYNRVLVESWKSDMEGLLIFAALFSAALTAFIIESYLSLNPDSGDLTVQLLEQISQ